MQLSSLKQVDSGSGRCLYKEMSSSAQSEPLEQATVQGESPDSIHVLWRNMGCLLWIKDIVAVSSRHVTLRQLPDVSSATLSLTCFCIFCLLRKQAPLGSLGMGGALLLVSGKRRVHLVTFVCL